MISIIIPIYNAEKYLEECLMSIRQQSYSKFEVICVDDGSKDKSAEIVKEFECRDARFKLYQQANAGVSAARNLGLSYATGEYVCFIDADDVVDANYLGTLYDLADDGSFAVCSYTRRIDRLGKGGDGVKKYTARDFIEKIIYESIEHPNICMMLFKNSIIQTQHLDFYVGCVRNEDTEFYLKYLMYEDKVKSTVYKGYYYRVNESSAMHVTTIRSLTGFDASKRIGKLLCEKGIARNPDIILFPDVQSTLFHISREKNIEIYEYIHQKYEVRSMMVKMLSYRALRRKFISMLYLFVGKDLFYRMLSSKYTDFLPL